MLAVVAEPRRSEMLRAWTVDLPNELPEGVAYVDIETEKVELANPVRGFPRRWRPFLVGLASGSTLTLVAGEEAELVAEVESRLSGKEVRYAATKRFDELVLTGRFTNARRAPLPEPGPWPAVAVDAASWKNLGRQPENDRAADVASIEAPVAWYDGRERAVLVHCLRDVVELLMADGFEPVWCRAVLGASVADAERLLLA